MNIAVHLERDDQTGKLRFRTDGNPVLAICVLLLIIALFCSAGVYFWRISATYFAYEGTITEIRRDRFSSWFIDESDNNWLLTIQPTDDGKPFVRMVSEFVIYPMRIEVGDYIVKEKGFLKKPSIPGKKTVDELIKDARRNIPR